MSFLQPVNQSGQSPLRNAETLIEDNAAHSATTNPEFERLLLCRPPRGLRVSLDGEQQSVNEVRKVVVCQLVFHSLQVPQFSCILSLHTVLAIPGTARA